MQSTLLLFRFGLVGLLNTAFGYAIYVGLVLAGLGPEASLVIGTIGGVAFNFQTSRRLVFRADGSVARFVLVFTVVLALNWILLHALRGAGFHDIPAQALLVLPMALLSYLGQHLFVFRPEQLPS